MDPFLVVTRHLNPAASHRAWSGRASAPLAADHSLSISVARRFMTAEGWTIRADLAHWVADFENPSKTSPLAKYSKVAFTIR
jgi:hypothetical protein